MPKLCKFFLLFAAVAGGYENTVCVSIVTHNAEETIWACLKSVREIATCISICDMGSTDRTKQFAENFFRQTGIPGKIYDRESSEPAYYSAIAASAAQKTLKSYGYSLTKSHILTLSPDQVVSLIPQNDEEWTEDVYLVLEKSALLSCYSYAPRLFRASLTMDNDTTQVQKKARSLSLTEWIPFEWTEEDLELPEEERSKLWQDFLKEYKQTKLKQHIALYTERLQKEPENASYLLSLAHSHKALEQYEEAISFYRKWLEKTADPETRWTALYMLGECQEERGFWLEALYWYLEAYQANPSRAESLRKISTYYRLRGESDLAYLFAKHGKQIPRLEGNRFFPSPPLSDYQFDEEVSITAYYTRYKEEGYAASSDLLLRKDTPYHIREQGYRNLLFYVQNLKASYAPIAIPLPLVHPDREETYHPMNPSIQKTPDGYKLICRSVNYTQTGAKHFHTNDPNGIFRTRNFLIHYDRNLQQMGYQEIVEDLPRKKTRDYIVQGLEDCRLFPYEGAFWFSCSTFDTNPSGAIQISLCKMETATLDRPVKVASLLPLKGPDPNRHEKNWLPFIKDGELCFVYGSDPFTLRKPNLNTGETTVIVQHAQEHDFSRFRGSAPPIEWDDGYLMLIHEVVQLPDYSRCYLHRFVYLTSDFWIEKVSRPFTFTHSGIEYCLSMTLDHMEEKLILPVGIEDHEAHLAFVDVAEVRAMLHPLPPVYPPF